MASELRVNTLKDASGNNSVATSFVAGGSAKAWAKSSGDGSPSLTNSFNIASLTDNDTGDQTYTYTSSMADANSSSTGSPVDDDTAVTMQNLGFDTTALTRFHSHRDDTGGGADSDGKHIVVHGDLA